MKDRLLKITIALLVLFSSLLLLHLGTNASQAGNSLTLFDSRPSLVTKTWARIFPGVSASSAALSNDANYVAIAGWDCWVTKLDGSGNVVWQKTYGGSNFGCRSADAIAGLQDGGFLVSGHGQFLGTSGAWLFRIDSSGNMVWERIYGGDWFNSIVQAGDGFVLAGSNSFGSGNDLWVVKLDSNGDVVWSKTYGGEIYADYANAVLPTTDGGYIVAGMTGSFGVGGDACWILKLDDSGNIIWQKTYGGPNYEEANAIIQTSDGGYAVAGHTTSIYGDGAWVLKLDASGNIIWQKAFGNGRNNYDTVFSILQTSNGGYIVTGGFYSYVQEHNDYWVIQLDASGNIIWQKTYGGIGQDEARVILPSKDGGYFVVGNAGPFGDASWGVLVLKIDAYGSLGGACSLASTASGRVEDSMVTPVSSSATPAIHIPTVVATNATVVDTTVIGMMLCPVSTIQYQFFPYVAR